MPPNAKSKKWYQIQWFSDEDTPEERKLIFKLDLLIVPYVILAYWVKYIDQTNLSTTPVSSLMYQLLTIGSQTMPTLPGSKKTWASRAMSSFSCKRCTLSARSWANFRSCGCSLACRCTGSFLFSILCGESSRYFSIASHRMLNWLHIVS